MNGICEHNSEKNEKWLTSRYTLEERLKTLNLDIATTDVLLIKPFIEFDAEFEVPHQSKKWFINDPAEIQQHREGWKCIEDSLLSPEIQLELELLERQKCARIIQLIGIQLCANQLCINHSIVLMHRFYIFHPVQMFPYEVIAGAAFSLGSKTEEQLKQSNQILMALLLALERPIQSKAVLDKFLDEIHETEKFMAMSLGYDFLVKHPKRYIEEACKLLNITNEEKHKLAAEEIANNSLKLTTFCIRYPPRLIAAFSIHLTSIWAKFKLDVSSEGKPWYYYIHKNITLGMLEIMTTEYLRNTAKASENLVFQLKLVKIQPPEKRRIAFEDEPPSTLYKFSREGEETDEGGSSRKRRDKFQNERLPEIEESQCRSSQKTFDSTKTNKCQLQNQQPLGKEFSDLTIPRLLPQHHLFDESKPPKSSLNNQEPSLFSDEDPAEFSIYEIRPESKIQTFQTTVLQSNMSNKFPSSKPTPKQRTVQYKPTLGEQLSSSKGIKSTVPLKIRPPRTIVKDDSQQEINEIIDANIPAYTTTKPSKQRISHYKKPVSETRQSSQTYDEPDIHDVAMNETVLSDFPSEISETIEVSTEGYTGDLSEKSHGEKSKKSKRKKNKHKIKHRIMKLQKSTSSCEKVQSDNSLKNPPLRMIFKKSSGSGSEYEIRNSTFFW